MVGRRRFDFGPDDPQKPVGQIFVFLEYPLTCRQMLQMSLQVERLYEMLLGLKVVVGTAQGNSAFGSDPPA